MPETLKGVLSRDMKDHPTCKYNKETSSVCRRVNGERKCETVWRVWRCCAKEKPVQIYTKSASSEGPGEPQKAFDSPQLFPRRDSGSGGGSMTEDPGEKPMGEMDIDIFAHMLRPFRNLATFSVCNIHAQLKPQLHPPHSPNPNPNPTSGRLRAFTSMDSNPSGGLRPPPARVVPAPNPVHPQLLSTSQKA